MVFKVYSSGEHIENINGFNVKDKKYKFAVNPYNRNKVHVSLTNNGLSINRQYDNLEEFFNSINSNKFNLIDNMKKDIERFEALPQVLYVHNTTQKSNRPPKKKSLKKPRKRKSLKR